MPPTKKTRRTVSKPAQASDRSSAKRRSPSETDIAMRAYELFVQRGGEHGRDMEDWLIAQQELAGR